MIPLDEGRLLIRKKYQNFLEKNEEKEQSKKNLQLAHQPYHEYMKRMGKIYCSFPSKNNRFVFQKREKENKGRILKKLRKQRSF